MVSHTSKKSPLIASNYLEDKSHSSVQSDCRVWYNTLLLACPGFKAGEYSSGNAKYKEDYTII